MNVAPENTIPAFKLSRDKGFKYVETDVRFTSDGVPVLLHDASINRTARNADGTELSDIVNIADITYAKSQTYDFGIWKDAVFTGTRIPKFKDFIIFCRNVGLHPYIELKVLDQTEAETLVGIVNDCGMLDNVTWVSSTASYLQLIKSIDASVRLGYFASAQATTSDVETAAALKGTENEVVFIPRVEGATSTIIAACKTSGLPCEAWGTNVSVSDILGLDDYISAVMANEVNASFILFNNAMN
jgi:glycerophosphoryl diester phosphodiesterase